MFSNVGIEKIFEVIKDRFENQWQTQVAHSFIPDKLDEIIRRRNVVAHTADALNITRSDLNESIKFLKTLANLLDLELKKLVEGIKR